MAAVTRRQYKGAAAQTTITNSLGAGDTTITIAATTGWPSTAAVPFFVVISPGTASEEKCLATISGSTLTLTRAQDDTTAQSHSSGATIYPVFSADDADEANFLASRYTTKGDVVVFDGTDVVRQGVGTNGHVLTADSTVTNGIKWATPTSTFTDTVFTDVSSATKSGVDVTIQTGQYGLVARVNSTDQTGPFIGFFKARGTASSQTIVSNGDDIGLLRFMAYDGATFREAARIKADVNGAPGSADMPGALSFQTTADGSATLTERMRINNNGLITGSGTSLGAWTAYTPTWTNFTIGNATQSWVYCQIGKLVFVRGQLTWGSTTSSTGGATVMSLPVNCKSTVFVGWGSAVFVDSGTQTYWGEVYPNSGSTVAWNTQVISGAYAVSSAVTSTAPFTWTTNDTIQGFFMYEAE